MTIPFIMVTALAIYGWIMLDDIEAKQKNEMVVKVTGQQFTWTFEYPAEKVNSPRARPAGGPPGRVQDPDEGRDPLLLGAAVPAEVGRRARASPRRSASRPTRTGATRWSAPSCAGSGHSTMRQFVRVVPASEFDSWLSDQQRGRGRRWRRRAEAARRRRRGGRRGERRADLHLGRLRRLPHAGRRGLDSEGRPRPRQARRTPTPRFIRESIVDPSAEIAEGFEDGVMPQNFGDKLSKEELDALVKYLLESQE